MRTDGSYLEGYFADSVVIARVNVELAVAEAKPHGQQVKWRPFWPDRVK